MKLEGNATSGNTMRGKISGLKTLRGYSAYEIAVINGFEGTEEEWLRSLQGEQGKDGEPGEKGEKGDPGESSMWKGSTPPTEPYYSLWLDTSGSATVPNAEEVTF